MSATFAQWMRQVDRVLESICGLDSMSLADWNYRDAYDDEMSASEAAEYVLDENGFPGYE